MAKARKVRPLYFPPEEIELVEKIREYALAEDLTFSMALWRLVELGLRRYEKLGAEKTSSRHKR